MSRRDITNVICLKTGFTEFNKQTKKQVKKLKGDNSCLNSFVKISYHNLFPGVDVYVRFYWVIQCALVKVTKNRLKMNRFYSNNWRERGKHFVY